MFGLSHLTYIFGLVVLALALLGEDSGVLAQFGLMNEMEKIINANDKTEHIVKAVIDAIDCAKALVDPDTITQEINEAEPQGTLGKVLKKYCGKIPDFKVCLNKLNDGVKPFISEEYSGLMTDVRKGLDSVLDFVCYKDGDRIASVLAQFEETGVNEEIISLEAAKVCENNNANDKTKEVVNAVTGAINCVIDLVDPVTIVQGNLDEVFKQNCGKIPDFKVCLNKLNDGVKPCISEEYSDLMTDVRIGLDSVLDFVCYKNGDGVAMFITEVGPKCLNDKKEKVQECRSTIQKFVTTLEDD